MGESGKMVDKVGSTVKSSSCEENANFEVEGAFCNDVDGSFGVFESANVTADAVMNFRIETVEGNFERVELGLLEFGNDFGCDEQSIGVESHGMKMFFCLANKKTNKIFAKERFASIDLNKGCWWECGGESREQLVPFGLVKFWRGGVFPDGAGGATKITAECNE